MSMHRNSRFHAGLTLVELLLAMTIMSYIAMAAGLMATGVRATAEYNSDRSTMLQHARVSIERISRMFQEAHVAKNYPGAAVVYDEIGTYRYPDTLIVWHPASTPSNPNGPPLISECVFYAPDPAAPSRLLEMTAPADTRQIPLDPAQLNTPAWRTALAQLKSATTTQKVVLTDLLRVSRASGLSGDRGVARFDVVVNPPASELAAYQAGTLAWKSMSWPTMLYGSAYGMQQIRLKLELHMVRSDDAGSVDTLGLEALPFFASSARYQQLTP